METLPNKKFTDLIPAQRASLSADIATLETRLNELLEKEKLAQVAAPADSVIEPMTPIPETWSAEDGEELAKIDKQLETIKEKIAQVKLKVLTGTIYSVEQLQIEIESIREGYEFYQLRDRKTKLLRKQVKFGRITSAYADRIIREINYPGTRPEVRVTPIELKPIILQTVDAQFSEVKRVLNILLSRYGTPKFMDHISANLESIVIADLREQIQILDPVVILPAISTNSSERIESAKDFKVNEDVFILLGNLISYNDTEGWVRSQLITLDSELKQADGESAALRILDKYSYRLPAHYVNQIKKLLQGEELSTVTRSSAVPQPENQQTEKEKAIAMVREAIANAQRTIEENATKKQALLRKLEEIRAAKKGKKNDTII